MARISPRTLLPALALAAALRPAPASASQCREVPFAQLMREADVIFTGRALTWDARLATTFAVDRIYKGTVPAQIVVESGAVKYAALAPPDRYLVLAVRNAPDTMPGNLYVHTCGGSQRLLQGTALPRELGDGTVPAAINKSTPTEPPPTEPPSTEPPPTEPPPTEPPPTEPPPPQPPPAHPIVTTPPAEAPPAPPPAGCASCSLTPSAPPLLLIPLLAWIASNRRRKSPDRVADPSDGERH